VSDQCQPSRCILLRPITAHSSQAATLIYLLSPSHPCTCHGLAPSTSEILYNINGLVPNDAPVVPDVTFIRQSTGWACEWANHPQTHPASAHVISAFLTKLPRLPTSRQAFATTTAWIHVPCSSAARCKIENGIHAHFLFQLSPTACTWFACTQVNAVGRRGPALRRPRLAQVAKSTFHSHLKTTSSTSPRDTAPPKHFAYHPGPLAHDRVNDDKEDCPPRRRVRTARARERGRIHESIYLRRRLLPTLPSCRQHMYNIHLHKNRVALRI